MTQAGEDAVSGTGRATDRVAGLAAIKARLAAATPGPWRVGLPMFRCLLDHGGDRHGGGKCRYTFAGWYEPDDEHDDSWSQYVSRDVAFTADDEQQNVPDVQIAGTWDYEGGGIRRTADAVLIATAPTDLAYLLAEVERLEHENHTLRESRAAVAAENARLRAAVHWMAEAGGWRLWYHAEPMPPGIANLFEEPTVGQALTLRERDAADPAQQEDRP